MRLAKRLVFAQAIDVATFCAFFILISVSPHAERNPLIAGMYALGGFALVGIIKLGYVGMVAARSTRYDAGPVKGYIGFRYRRPIRTRPATGVVIAISVATASGIAGAGFNLASLVDSLR